MRLYLLHIKDVMTKFPSVDAVKSILRLMGIPVWVELVGMITERDFFKLVEL